MLYSFLFPSLIPTVHWEGCLAEHVTKDGPIFRRVNLLVMQIAVISLDASRSVTSASSHCSRYF